MPGPIANNMLEKWLVDNPSFQLITISDKGVVYRQGDICSHVFLIVRGIVKLVYVSRRGNALTVALLRRGDLLGCLQVHPAAERMEETALAVGDVHLYECEQSKFREFLSRQSEVAWQVVDRLSARRQQAERKLRGALTQSVETRVIETLKELSEMFGIRCTHGYALEIHLTQQELADLIGANRSVVSTIMNELRNRGLLDYTRDLICVHDRVFADSCKQLA